MHFAFVGPLYEYALLAVDLLERLSCRGAEVLSQFVSKPRQLHRL